MQDWLTEYISMMSNDKTKDLFQKCQRLRVPFNKEDELPPLFCFVKTISFATQFSAHVDKFSLCAKLLSA